MPRIDMNPAGGSLHHLRFDSLDPLCAWAGDHGRHARVVHEQGPLGFEARLARGPATQAAWSRIAVSQTLQAAPVADCVHLYMDHDSELRFGRGRVHLRAGGIAFLPSGWEHTRRSRPGSTFAVAVDPGRVATEAAARRAVPVEQVALEGHASESHNHRHCAVVLALEALAEMLAVPAGQPGPQRLAEAELVAALVDLLEAGERVVRSPAVDAARVALLEEWIDAHLDEPITIGRLSANAGVGARSLQMAFEARRGVTPMRFVAMRRLVAVWRRLVRPRPSDTVASVAAASGFTHLGRFAGLYRAAFGEPPSATLARARAMQ